MVSNLDSYKNDLDSLLKNGDELLLVMERDWDYGDKVNQALMKRIDERAKAFIEHGDKGESHALPSFVDDYQTWYSEGIALLRQLLPDRLPDFIRHYEKPKQRKAISAENYRIEDLLQGVSVIRQFDGGSIAGPRDAIPHFRQQLAILKSVKRRFESSLFDIHQLVQADVFDSELEAAKELAKHKFTRAAGAVAGVVLERHLRQVCDNHTLRVAKKPVISQLNDVLKNASVIDVSTWRFIQHLADVRNLCDHGGNDPTHQQVDDLIGGVMKITKTVF
jgi:hypothetical protein